ncbi:MAG: FadR family transcriptional regulator [Victivallales bacterium]|nr:FadR family transcriptional regulator [Victivallales bacterium]
MKCKENKTERTINAILTYIVNNRLSIGDTLPSESELVSMLGVSRMCLRESLLGLKFLGVLRSHTRGGTQLNKVDFKVLNRIVGFQISLLDYSLKKLLEARLTIELGALDILSGNMTEENFQHLKKQASTMEGSTDLCSRARKDCAFHQELLRLSGNEILLSFSQLMEIFFFKYIEKLPKHKDDLAKSITGDSEHIAILEALRDGNTELARGMLKKHLSRYLALNA